MQSEQAISKLRRNTVCWKGHAGYIAKGRNGGSNLSLSLSPSRLDAPLQHRQSGHHQQHQHQQHQQQHQQHQPQQLSSASRNNIMDVGMSVIGLPAQHKVAMAQREAMRVSEGWTTTVPRRSSVATTTSPQRSSLAHNEYDGRGGLQEAEMEYLLAMRAADGSSAPCPIVTQRNGLDTLSIPVRLDIQVLEAVFDDSTTAVEPHSEAAASSSAQTPPLPPACCTRGADASCESASAAPKSTAAVPQQGGSRTASETGSHGASEAGSLSSVFSRSTASNASRIPNPTDSRPGKPSKLPAIPKQAVAPRRRPPKASKWKKAAGQQRLMGAGDDYMLRYLQTIDCSPEMFDKIWKVAITRESRAQEQWGSMRTKMKAMSAFSSPF